MRPVARRERGEERRGVEGVGEGDGVVEVVVVVVVRECGEGVW